MPKGTPSKIRELMDVIVQLMMEEEAHNEKQRPKNKDGFNSMQTKLLSRLKELITKEALTNDTNRDKLLTLIFNRLDQPKYQAIFNYIFCNILKLKLTEDEWSHLLTTKIDRFFFFEQMVLLSNQDNLLTLITLITTLNERIRIQFVSGMIHYLDAKNHINYTPILVKNITAVLALMDSNRRGLLLSSRDEDGQNLLAYAVRSEQPLLVELILSYFEDVQQKDGIFLLNPTYEEQDSEQIHLYILQTPKLYSSVSKINDLELLATLIKAKSSNGQTCLETAIIETERQRIRQLLLLIKKLESRDQEEIIDQLSLKAKEKLIENTDYQDLILANAEPAIQDRLENSNPKALSMFFRQNSVPVDKTAPLNSNLFPYKECP